MNRKTSTVCLCMIVKNEQRYLRQCIKSVEDIIDEIVVVDTGSTDDTIQIAKNYGAKLYEIPWENNFSKARNIAVSHVDSDWILLLDADEILEETSKQTLLTFIRTTKEDGAYFQIYNYKDKEQGKNYMIHNGIRLFRNNQGYLYEGKIHEQVVREYHGNRGKTKFPKIPVIVHHYGYLEKVVEEKDKRGRNMPIIMQEIEHHPDNPYLLDCLGNEYNSLGDTKKAIELYEKVLLKKEEGASYLPGLYLRLSVCYIKEKEFEKAIEIAYEAKNQYLQYMDYNYILALAWYELKEYKNAINQLQEIRAPKMPGARQQTMLGGCNTYLADTLLGDILMEQGEYDQAVQCYMKVLYRENEQF